MTNRKKEKRSYGDRKDKRRTEKSVENFLKGNKKISDVDVAESVAKFGERMRFYRKLRGMTQKDISRCSGINPVSITLYETGKSIPSYEMILRLAKRLGVTPNDLMGVESPVRSGEIRTRDFSSELQQIRKTIMFPYGVMLSDDELKEFALRYCLNGLSHMDETEKLLDEITK